MRQALLGGISTLICLLLFWQLVVFAFQMPSYMLPSPLAVAERLVSQAPFLAQHAWITFIEILIGLLVGVLLGSLLALAMSEVRLAERAIKPLIIISQAFPVFALAPILVLWFGYGLGSKIVMSALIIFFPVASTFYDGLKNTDPDLMDLGRVYGASRQQLMRLIKIPAAAPALASGLRMAATVAPIGAVIGEWVGASQGLGFVMLRASARVQIDTMFAALVVLAVMALALRFIVDVGVRRVVHWMPQSYTL